VALSGLVLVSGQSLGQIRAGIKAGVNSSSISGIDIVGVSNVTRYTGWNAGIFVGFKLPVISIQADVLYSLEGVKYTQDLTPLPGSTEVTQELTYINIPVVAKISLIPVLNIQAGLQYGILTKAEVETDLGTTDVKDNLNGGNTSIVLGLGLDVSKLMVELRYNIGLTDLNNDSSLPISPTLSVIQLDVGLRLK